MNKVLRCIILSSLFVMSMVASVLAAPYDPPVAIATPPIDRALLAAYGEAAHGADIRFTIKEDGSVGDVEVVSSSGTHTELHPKNWTQFRGAVFACQNILKNKVRLFIFIILDS